MTMTTIIILFNILFIIIKLFLKFLRFKTPLQYWLKKVSNPLLSTPIKLIF